MPEPIDWSGYTKTTITRTTQLVSGAYYRFLTSYKTADQANIAHNLADFLSKWNNQYADRFEILEIYGPPGLTSGVIEIYGKARCEKGGETPNSLGLDRYWATRIWSVLRGGKWHGGEGIEGVRYYEMYQLILSEIGTPGNEPATPEVPQPGETPAPGEPSEPRAPSAGKGIPVWGWIGIALGVAVVLFMLLKRK